MVVIKFMKRFNNLKLLKKRRKNLRDSMPAAEIVLWSRLKNSQLKGLKFRRQHSIGKYVVDFYCPKHKLAIEIDGQSHEKSEKQDERRQKFIEFFGIKVLRFTNYDIYKNTNEVLEFILDSIPPRSRLGGTTPP